MKIHEYQARTLLSDAGIPVPPGRMIESIEDAAAAYKAACPGGSGGPGGLAVIKAQVHAGGRGKAGFVKLVHSAEEATQAARFMLTNRMKSPQTPPEGLEVTKLLVAAGVDIAERQASGTGHQASAKDSRGAAASSPSAQSPVPSASPREEFYLAITTDRKSRRNTLIASREGGVEIEQVAHDRPDAIIKEPIHPLLGLQPHQARRIAFNLGFKGKQATQAAKIMLDLARLFAEKDCTLAEINPLVIAQASGTGHQVSANDSRGAAASSPSAQSPVPSASTSASVMAIDAKFNFDDNALFRHADLQAMADPTEENPAETRAHRFGLSYIALDGAIGCLVNGAGLAMATMDIIKLHGADKGIEPANFLDVGGSASEEAVTEAFSIILSDPKVKGVLVNIFGGIMKCDIIAQGIINAARGYKNPDGSTGFKVPLVVGLEGTNVDAGRKLLEDARKSIPTMQAATDLADAAKRVCAAVEA